MCVPKGQEARPVSRKLTLFKRASANPASLFNVDLFVATIESVKRRDISDGTVQSLMVVVLYEFADERITILEV